MDGIELLSKIKKSFPQTMVMIITGHASAETAITALRKGAYDYIIKPLPHYSELLHRINQALERQRLGSENKQLFEDLKKSYGNLEAHKEHLEEKVIVSDKKIQEKDKDLKETYKELEKAYKTLEAHVEEMKRMDRLAAMGEFSARIVHELRNPLTSIEGFIQLLPRKYDSPGFKEKFIETTTRETERINKFVDRLLKFGRPPEPIFKSCDINKIVAEALESTEKQLVEGKASVVKNLARDLPEITADSESIMQILVNLINNSIHAMPKSGTLTISTQEAGKEFVEVVVKDTGCGIAEKDLPKIFEPFFTTKSKGTGLGLAIGRNIIEKHKGKINVESIVNKGTTFTVKLPIKQ